MNKPDVVSQKEFDEVVKKCIMASVDPYLIFAIGLHETGWGAKGWGKHGYILGVGCYDKTHSDKSLKGFSNQIGWAIFAIAEFMDFRVTEKALEDFAKYVWKPKDPIPWAAGVWRWYIRLINTHAPEIPICQAPPAWAITPLLHLYEAGIINTPFGDFDFYRMCQMISNVVVLFKIKKIGEKDAKN